MKVCVCLHLVPQGFVQRDVSRASANPQAVIQHALATLTHQPPILAISARTPAVSVGKCFRSSFDASCGCLPLQVPSEWTTCVHKENESGAHWLSNPFSRAVVPNLDEVQNVSTDQRLAKLIELVKATKETEPAEQSVSQWNNHQSQEYNRHVRALQHHGTERTQRNSKGGTKRLPPSWAPREITLGLKRPDNGGRDQTFSQISRKTSTERCTIHSPSTPRKSWRCPDGWTAHKLVPKSHVQTAQSSCHSLRNK